jgi:hypothetical protein
MSFSWAQYLNIAYLLNECKDPELREAAIRAAISRAYYAAHCIARNHILSKDRKPFSKNDRPTHHEVINYLKKHRYQSVGSALSELLILRENCDYRNEGLDDPELAMESALRNSKKIINALSPYSSTKML